MSYIQRIASRGSFGSIIGTNLKMTQVNAKAKTKDISNTTEDGMQRTRRRFPKNSVSQYIVLHQKKVPKGRKTCPNYIRYWGNINSPF